jgi:putative SOS response-associated peptidase YedK
MKWGLKTAYTIDTGKVQINARAETLKQKKTFSKLLQSNRCVLVAEGYYEWAKTPSGISLLSTRVIRR